MKQLIKTETSEEIIKKSTFITVVAPIISAEEALSFIEKNSVVSATHNCWAYKVGQLYRFNDDGEPSGTAGKPILNAITGQGFDNTVALVIRHYGGIKLGTGGLMRAYGGSVSRCLQNAEFTTIKSYHSIKLSVPFNLTQSVYNLAANYQAQVESEHFNSNGAEMQIKILSEKSQDFEDDIINQSKGRALIINE